MSWKKMKSMKILRGIQKKRLQSYRKCIRKFGDPNVDIHNIHEKRKVFQMWYFNFTVQKLLQKASLLEF